MCLLATRRRFKFGKFTIVSDRHRAAALEADARHVISHSSSIFTTGPRVVKINKEDSHTRRSAIGCPSQP